MISQGFCCQVVSRLSWRTGHAHHNISNKSINTNLYNVLKALIEDLNAQALPSGGVNRSQSWYRVWILLQRLGVGKNVISLPFQMK